MLAKILFNRRHTADGGDDPNGVTVWLTTQNWNRNYRILMLRKVANGLIAWKLRMSKEHFMSIFKEYVYRDPYDFLFMSMDEPYDKMYHWNFNTLVIDEV